MTDEFRFYSGAASTSARAALKKLEVGRVLINYATMFNEPWDGIEDLIIDSGGYSQAEGKVDYETTDAEYLSFIEEHDPDFYALRDYLCIPDIGKPVRHQQERTTEHARALLELIDERGTPGQPVTVIQGWQPAEYLEHLDELRDAGLLTDTVAVGSVMRDAEYNEQVVDILTAVREALPSRYDLHGFGLKKGVLRSPRAQAAVDSADSCVYEFHKRKRACPLGDWRDMAFYYLQFVREVEAASEVTAVHKDQRTVADFAGVTR